MPRKASAAAAGPTFTNEHCAYAALSRKDRHALRDLLKTAFPIGGSSHALWSEFPDTTAFLRRASDGEASAPRGIVAGAIVMSHLEDQYDYLAYLAVLPAFRNQRRLFGRGGQPHHGTQLLRHIYEVMRDRVGPGHEQRYLMIEPAGDEAMRFYRRALDPNEYAVKFHPDEPVISVSYDSLWL